MNRQRKKFTEKQLTVISILVAAGVLVALSAGILLGVARAGTLREETEKMQQTRDDLVRKEAELPKLRAEIDSLELEVERMVRILPNDQEIANLVKNLDELTDGTREGDKSIKVTGFQPDEEKRLPGTRKKDAEAEAEAAFTAHPYLVQAQGNYYHFGKFINLLESHIRFINTCAFEISMPKEKNLQSQPIKLITIRMVTYTYNRDKDKAAREAVERRDVPEELLGIHGFVFEHKGRRDPFETALSQRGQGSVLVRQRLSAEEQRRLILDAESMLTQMKQCIVEGMTDDALKNYIAIEETYGKRFTKQDYYVRIGEIYNEAKREIEKIKEAAAMRAIIRAESAIALLEGLFNEGDYEKAAALDDRVQRELAGVKAFDAALKNKIEALAKSSSAYADRARIRLEMKNADVVIVGFVRVGVPIAILNNEKHVVEGEDVELNGMKFHVVRINVDKETMLVLYKGEQVTIEARQFPVSARPPAVEAPEAKPPKEEAPKGETVEPKDETGGADEENVPGSEPPAPAPTGGRET